MSGSATPSVTPSKATQVGSYSSQPLLRVPKSATVSAKRRRQVSDALRSAPSAPPTHRLVVTTVQPFSSRGGGLGGGGVGGDNASSWIATAGGEETAVTDTMLANAAGSVLSRRGLIVPTVRSEKFCRMMAVEDGLAVLALSLRAPGTIACRLLHVIDTSSGGL